VLAVAFGLGVAAIVPRARAADEDSARLYRERCAACHDQPKDRTPARDALRALKPEVIVEALTRGSMRVQGEALDESQRRALALYLSDQPFAAAALAEQAAPAVCSPKAGALALRDTDWNGWGLDLHNTRFQPRPGLDAADVPRLKVKWVYEYPGRSAYGQPTIVGGRVFVTSSFGRVSALDAATGCVLWSYEAARGVKSPVVVAALSPPAPARTMAFFGDESANVHAIDAETGAALWKTTIDTHVVARISGATRVFEGLLLVPVSSSEEVAAGQSVHYSCCTFRGSLVALDARSGRVVWRTYTIERKPEPFMVNSSGTQMFGPAGAAIWSSPTVDAKRRIVYAATGNAYTTVADVGSDAVHAWQVDTGKRLWVKQLTPDDAYLVSCQGRAGVGNCPAQAGPDVDFGSPPLLRTTADGRQLLIASQKSGVVYALDPERQGEVVWQAKLGTGGPLGGIEHGPAADATQVYAAVSDLYTPGGAPRPGLSALRIDDGQLVWHVPTPPASCTWGSARCARAQAAAVSAMPGVVFSGAFDGHIRAYDARSGAVVWDHDTGQTYTTVQGGKAHGGAIDMGGTTIADGVVYVNSGFGNWGAVGHVLIAFSVDGK